MAEYIDREATIKRIQEVYCADCNSYNGVRCRTCGTGDAIDVIEDAPAADVVPAAQWIPITERLPEKWLDDAGMVNYMIYSPDFGVDIGCYHAEAKKWLCMALPCTVTHWMPLPEPPEMDGGADND